MKLEKKAKKLDKLLKTSTKFKSKPKVNIIYGNRTQPEDIKMKLEENSKQKKIKELNFLARLLRMIYEGATGFDLAYEVEKNREVNHLIHDGILFYNTFLEIGSKKFIEVPDKKIEDYKSFKTVEDTEKYIFMLYLDENINSLQEELYPKEDYAEYLKFKKSVEVNKVEKTLDVTFTHCKNCGARIYSKEQKFCETCGVKLME